MYFKVGIPTFWQIGVIPKLGIIKRTYVIFNLVQITCINKSEVLFLYSPLGVMDNAYDF